MSPNLSLKKATNTLLRIFVGRSSKITFLLVQQAQKLRDFASNTDMVSEGSSLGSRDLCREKKFGDKAIDR